MKVLITYSICLLQGVIYQLLSMEDDNQKDKTSQMEQRASADGVG